MKDKKFYTAEEFLDWMKEKMTLSWDCKRCEKKTKVPIKSPFPENKDEVMCPDCFKDYCEERNKK